MDEIFLHPPWPKKDDKLSLTLALLHFLPHILECGFLEVREGGYCEENVGLFLLVHLLILYYYNVEEVPSIHVAWQQSLLLQQVRRTEIRRCMTGPKKEQIGVVGAHLILWTGTLIWVAFEWFLLSDYFTFVVPALGIFPLP